MVFRFQIPILVLLKTAKVSPPCSAHAAFVRDDNKRVRHRWNVPATSARPHAAVHIIIRIDKIECDGWVEWEADASSDRGGRRGGRGRRPYLQRPPILGHERLLQPARAHVVAAGGVAQRHGEPGELREQPARPLVERHALRQRLAVEVEAVVLREPAPWCATKTARSA
jgi:hypothetical protein